MGLRGARFSPPERIRAKGVGQEMRRDIALSGRDSHKEVPGWRSEIQELPRLSVWSWVHLSRFFAKTVGVRLGTWWGSFRGE